MYAAQLARLDTTIKTIPWDKRISQQAQQLYRRPYIFSDHEFLLMLETAFNLPSPLSPLRPRTVHMMLVLAYCAGLRLGEIVRLNVRDFDVDNGIIVRNEAGAPTSPDAALFCHMQAAGRYSRVRAGSLLTRVLRRAKLKPVPGRGGPRVHDLRHAFVVNRMLTWYREGINPQAHLPYLATYLGHRDINSTLVCISQSPRNCFGRPASGSAGVEPRYCWTRRKGEKHESYFIPATPAHVLSRLACAATKRLPPHSPVLPGQLAAISPVRGRSEGHIRCPALAYGSPSR